jgi:hypothetical protein
MACFSNWEKPFGSTAGKGWKSRGTGEITIIAVAGKAEHRDFGGIWRINLSASDLW